MFTRKCDRMKCIGCGKEVNEVCGDGYCRSCHVGLSFEDCVSGEWVRRRADSIPQRYARGCITGDYDCSNQTMNRLKEHEAGGFRNGGLYPNPSVPNGSG